MVLRSPGPIAAVVVLSMALAACDEREGTQVLGTFSLASPSPVVSAAIVPTTLPFHVTPVIGCPFAPSFASNFSVIVEAADVDLILTEVGLQFVDASGAVSPLTFSQNDLTVLFDSLVVTAGRSRQFAFQTNFGCGFRSVPELMFGRLSFADRRGGRVERTVTARMGAMQ